LARQWTLQQSRKVATPVKALRRSSKRVQKESISVRREEDDEEKESVDGGESKPAAQETTKKATKKERLLEGKELARQWAVQQSRKVATPVKALRRSSKRVQKESTRIIESIFSIGVDVAIYVAWRTRT
jgi:hypothetical protein